MSGKILTEQYKVQKCGSVWCDYVFDKDYKLLPLTELEKAIQQLGHLPKTKSAADIKKEEGIDAAETLLNHQANIEEIFLHLIALKKEITGLQKEEITLELEQIDLLLALADKMDTFVKK